MPFGMDYREMIHNAKYSEDDIVVLCAVTEFVGFCHSSGCKTTISNEKRG